MAQNAAVDVRGCKINIRRSGQGEPLLFLHGAQEINRNERALDELAQRFDVIAPDHPGFGRSDSSRPVDDVGDLAFFYLDVLDTLALDRVHIVGQCIGGWIALEMAVRTGARMKSLVLLNSAGIRIKGVPRADMFICAEDELVKMLFAGTRRRRMAGDLARHAGPRGDLRPQPRGGCEILLVAAAVQSQARAVAAPHRRPDPHRLGQGGQVIPPAYAAALKGLIAGASVAILPGCAHLPHIEQPQVFAEQVTQFIQRAAP